MSTLNGIESTLIRGGGRLLSRSGRQSSLLVLIYHRVLPDPDPMLPTEPDAARFETLMDMLVHNFNVLPLREAVGRLRQGSLPSRSVCVTFDDGYANNFSVAMPILQKRGLPATVFVAPGYLNGGCMFNDAIFEACRVAPAEADLTEVGLGTMRFEGAPARVEAAQRIIDQLKYLPQAQRQERADWITSRLGKGASAELMMTDAQVAKMSHSGIEIGAHTMTHPILLKLGDDQAREEIVRSRRRLEEITGTQVSSFAYPNGRPDRDYGVRHVEVVREAGFELAVSTSWGAATANSDPFQIPRVAPWDSSPLRYAARMVNAYRQRKFACATA